jgi:membrane protease YdiL (CAAX protease family)
MKRNFGISQYGVGVIILYLVLIPFLVEVKRVPLRYDLTSEHIFPVALLFFASLAVFSFFLLENATGSLWKFTKIPPAFFWGVVFAVPEEILFRGFIQMGLQTVFDNVVIAILLSSFIFGLAHLPNGANGWRINDWSWKFAGLAFFGGLPLGLLFALTGSLLLPTALHAFFVTCLRLSTR